VRPDHAGVGKLAADGTGQTLAYAGCMPVGPHDGGNDGMHLVGGRPANCPIIGDFCVSFANLRNRRSNG
jgi:hypothetical protein